MEGLGVIFACLLKVPGPYELSDPVVYQLDNKGVITRPLYVHYIGYGVWGRCMRNQMPLTAMCNTRHDCHLRHRKDRHGFTISSGTIIGIHFDHISALANLAAHFMRNLFDTRYLSSTLRQIDIRILTLRSISPLGNERLGGDDHARAKDYSFFYRLF